MPTFRQDVKLGTRVPLINGDDISNGSIGIDKLDSELLDILNSLMDTDIAMTDLDLDATKIKLCLTGKFSTQRRVIGSVRDVAVPVGTLEMFSDIAGRQLIQILTTSYMLTADGKIDGGLSELGEVNRYRRYYDTRKNQWSDWVSDIAAIESMTTEDIDQLFAK